MIAPLRLGVATAAQPNGPVIETQRLKLRQWRMADVAPYTAMLADPGTARFITVDGKSVADAMTGWRHTVVMAGHWALHGAGMFAVEEKSSGNFVGRVGPWFPPGWPDFEIGWGITKHAQGKGYAVEAARPSISIGSSIASTARTSPPKALRGGSELRSSTRSSCSAMPRMSG